MCPVLRLVLCALKTRRQQQSFDSRCCHQAVLSATLVSCSSCSVSLLNFIYLVYILPKSRVESSDCKLYTHQFPFIFIWFYFMYWEFCYLIHRLSSWCNTSFVIIKYFSFTLFNTAYSKTSLSDIATLPASSGKCSHEINKTSKNSWRCELKAELLLVLEILWNPCTAFSQYTFPWTC